MGRPRRFSPGEGGFADRARTMLAPHRPRSGSRSAEKLKGSADWSGESHRVSSWSSPPGLPVPDRGECRHSCAAAGNVVLEALDQTPLCAERMVEAGRKAGLPDGA